MLNISFSFDDECPAWMNEDSAAYQVDGPLKFSADGAVLFEEPSAPLIELAVFLTHWMTLSTAARARTHSFCPTDYAEQDAPLFQLAPLDGTRYVLSWPQAALITHWTAEQAELYAAFAQFLALLRHALQEVYHLSLDNILQRFSPSKQ